MNKSTTVVCFGVLIASVSQDPKTPDLSRDLGLPVSGIEALDAATGRSERSSVAKLVGKPTSYIAGIKLYRGRVVPRKGGEAVAARLASVPLAKPATGARVVVAMGSNGELLGAGVGGNAAFEKDATGRWKRFVRSVAAEGSPKDRNRTLSYDRTDSVVASIGKGSPPTADLVRWLVRTRRDMIYFSMSLGMLFDRLEAGANAADVDQVLVPLRAKAAALTKSEPLAEVLGKEGVKRFAAAAEQTLAVFDKIREQVAAGNTAAAFKHLDQSFAAGMCNNCHATKQTGLAKNWRRTLEAKVRKLGIPTGMMQVGYDVPAAVGDDGAMSREVAVGLRSAILLLDRLR